MANPRLEKVKGEIAKTKAKIAEYQAKLREQERLKTRLENDEVIAMFRKENLSEEEFSALLHATQRRNEADTAGIATADMETEVGAGAEMTANVGAERQPNKNGGGSD